MGQCRMGIPAPDVDLSTDTAPHRRSGTLCVLGGSRHIRHLGVNMLRQYIALQTLLRSRRDDRGATAVEYGLMVALIAVAIIATVTALGGQLNTLFTSVKNGITPAA
jgi:pilus assembly protein Flp/PilA